MSEAVRAASANGRARVRYDLSRRGLPARDLEALLAWLEAEDCACAAPALERIPLVPAPAGGSAELRAAIAAQCDSGIGAEQIVVTTGRAAALALLASALDPAGRTVVLDAPIDRRACAPWSSRGARLHPIPRRFENGWRIELERWEAALQRADAVAAHVITPHDPTGLAMTEAEICRLAAVAEREGRWLLVDETARDLQPGAILPVAAGLSPRVITLGSLSETHGLPGLRLAWLVVRDEALRARIRASDREERTRPCALDEAVAWCALQARDRWREEQNVRLRLTRDTVRRWAAGHGASVAIVVPETGSVALARLEPLAGRALGPWYEALRDEFGVALAPGARFGLADHHVRIGYGALVHDDLVMGLAQLGAALRAFARP